MPETLNWMNSKTKCSDYQAKLLLQFLICIVNAELFKAINFKSFKATSNTEHTHDNTL